MTNFGGAALLQKLAIGAATAAFGLALGAVGYRVNVEQSWQTRDGMRCLLLAAPATALSAVCIAANPFRRDTHARSVAALRERRAATPP